MSLKFCISFIQMVEFCDARLVRLEGKDAETITNAILVALEEDGLDIQYLVGLGTDGTSTLIRHRSGVYAWLKERQPELVVVQCVCHSLAKAADYAFDELPSNLEVLVRDVYGYFSHSNTRKDRYEQVSITLFFVEAATTTVCALFFSYSFESMAQRQRSS